MADQTRAIYFCLLISLFGADAAKLPSYIKKCSLSDPKLSDCYKDRFMSTVPQIIHGDKELKIPVISPFHVKEIVIESTSSLVLKLYDIDIHGLENTIFNDIRSDIFGGSAGCTAVISKITILGTYDISGNILFLPINGNGPANITIENIVFDINLDMNVRKDGDGVEYIDILAMKVDYESDRIYYHFDNLFNGDKALGEQMNSFVNENWVEFSKDIKPAVTKTIMAILQSIFQSLTKLIPLYELFDP